MTLPEFRADGWLPTGHHLITWDEIADYFGGDAHSKRTLLLNKLFSFRDELRACGCAGRMILDGSFISAKPVPGDFDVLLVLQPNIQQMKDSDPKLCKLLDAEMAENESGYSVFYSANNSPVIAALMPMWDNAKDGTPKGVVEVEI